MSNFQKIDFIRTPLPMLQVITGGGIRFSTLVELYGSNKSGKTTTCYQSGGYFLDDYGDEAELKVLDSEISIDYNRLLSFGIHGDDPRLEIVPAAFIEDGMLKIFKWIEGLKPNHKMMIIWDTLSASPSRSAYDSAMTANKPEELKMYSGGMIDRPRIIKHYLRQVMTLLYGRKASLWMPNQVFATLDTYGPAMAAGEGSALKHDKHYSLLFARRDSDVTVEEGSCAVVQTVSGYCLTKSKFSPEFKGAKGGTGVPLYIDNTQGGVIDERLSLFYTSLEEQLIIQKGGWYKLDEDGKSYHMSEFIESDDTYRELVSRLILKFRSKFPTVDRIYLSQGYPPLADSQKSKPKNSLSFNDCFKSNPVVSTSVSDSCADDSQEVESENSELDSSSVDQ